MKDKEREAHKMRKDIIDLKAQNEELKVKNKDLSVNKASALRVSAGPPRAAVQPKPM